MKFRYLILSILFAASAAFATATDLVLPASIQGEVGDFISVPAKTKEDVVKWKSPNKQLKLLPMDLLKDSRTAIVHSSKPGKYKLFAVTADKSGNLSEIVETEIVITGETEPTPPTPTPPGPTPPTPQPADPAPIPAPGFRVLIIYETLKVTTLPADQQNAIFSKAVADYLNARCIKGVDMKTPEFRFYDPAIDASADGPIWVEAMKRPRKSLPWLIVSDGNKGYEGPLPPNEAELLTLLKKYGG